MQKTSLYILYVDVPTGVNVYSSKPFRLIPVPSTAEHLAS